MFKEEALEVLKNRRAIRKFKPEQITDEELNAVLEAGTYAPTGEGRQSPLIVAVQSPEYVERVSYISAALMGFRFSAYYGAPTIILVFETARAGDAEMGIIDASAVCTNMVNAAYAVGLGSCWIHRCKEVFETPEGKELLCEWGITEPVRGVASIALGYADCPHPKARARREGYVVKV